MYECSSKPDEIWERYQQIQYRKTWLEALLQEVQLGLEALPEKEAPPLKKKRPKPSSVEVMMFINELSSLLLEFEEFEDKTQTSEALKKRQERLQYQKFMLEMLLDNLNREIQFIISEVFPESKAEENQPSISALNMKE